MPVDETRGCDFLNIVFDTSPNDFALNHWAI